MSENEGFKQWLLKATIAVNSHEDLIGALEAIVIHTENECGHALVSLCIEEIQALAKQALKKVGGK